MKVDYFTNRRLKLVLMPTEQCNFRCTYCYESFALKEMRPELVLAVEKLVSRRSNNLDRLEIAWFGGEPLLALPVIKRIMGHALRELELEKLFGTMTTNGSLLSADVMSELLCLGIKRFQISLDGFGAVHDATRRNMGGGATFHKIWNNLLECQKTKLPFSINLRVHVHADNLDYLPELLREIRSQFSADNRFSVFFKPLGRYGGPNDNETNVLSRSIERIAIDGLEHLLGLPGRSSRGTEQALLEAEAVCYASEPNSFVVRADGRLCKCTVKLESPMNQVGRLMDDGTLAIDSEKMRFWMRGFESGDRSVLLCPAYVLDSLAPVSEQPAKGSVAEDLVRRSAGDRVHPQTP